MIIPAEMAVDIYWSVSLMKIIYYIIPVIAGWILDLIIGDPHCIYHPVRLIGWLIGKLDKMLYKYTDSNRKNIIKVCFSGYL